MIAIRKAKVEYGDYQTPIELANLVCQKLIELNVNPDFIIEPTCGVGSFIKAASRSFPSAQKILGVEINPEYLEEVAARNLLQDNRIELKQGDFFQFDWLQLIQQFDGKPLILGNFPWVTNSRQGAIGGENLPQKSNFQKHSGLDAITGKSNFDISEWMLIQVVRWLQQRDAHLAMLCKSSIARKLLSYIYSKNLNLAYCSTYKIDAKKYFDADVEACLLFCQFDSSSQNYFCDVFDSLKSLKFYRIGYQSQTLIKDINAFKKFEGLFDQNTNSKWRSGIKHDCSSVMEFRKVGNKLTNGLGEIVELEADYLFPLIKGSDVAKKRVSATNRFVLVTQKYVGEPTESIENFAPKTWQYLQFYSQYLANRKSRIYHNNPRFSIFGVGEYTFAPWKIAICGLYKKLEFRLIGEIEGKPSIFDDTVYFLSFTNEQTARKTLEALTSVAAIEFYSSLIFWDEKRPIKTSILNRLNLEALAEMQ
ncbi:MAG: class I SAM-dependent methyltransferase [Leptolyngbyaceae cyanobacterium SM1_3_5]|nr:class I SAM-dependent methyltransferase [Leptolyngbyaceae cyanobacterium SM1_3_5]